MKADFLNPSQAQIKSWARLADAKVRREEGLFIAEGVKVVAELLASNWQTKAIFVLPEKAKYWEKLSEKLPPDMPIYQLSLSQWHKISQDKEPEGIMALVSLMPALSLAQLLTNKSGNLLVLHEINNPGNLGALMRSAQWFGFSNIILSTNSTDYTNPKVIRTSMGSIFHLTIVSDIDLIAAIPQIKKTHYLAGSDVQSGLSPHPLSKKTALLLGSESHGLPEQLLNTVDERWCIPGNAQADSLSLPQAAAIMMYECAKK
jgi:TrmH family RNA methyltransferase